MSLPRTLEIAALLCLVSAPAAAQENANQPPPSGAPAEAKPKPYDPGADEQRAASEITAEVIARHTAVLASDRMLGRGPGTYGDLLAQRYIARKMKALGLRPMGDDGTYLQRFELVGVQGHPEELTIAGGGGEPLSLAWSEDFVASAGAPREKTKVSNAEIVFVGYGIDAPEFQWNDYAGANLKGKVALIVNNDPEGDPEHFGGERRLWYGRWDYKYEQAARMGAVGAIIIHTRDSAGYPWQVVQTSWSGEEFHLPGDEGPKLQMASWVTEDAARRIVEKAGKDLDSLVAASKERGFKAVPLGVKLSAAFESEVRKTETANVLGMLPGRDRRRHEQVVLYTAHYDHLGRDASAEEGEDAIYNGAVDNAGGVASMLAIAKAFTMDKQRRSILFAAVGAEEQGLLGSEYLAKNPPVRPGNFVVNINMDGINVLGRTNDVSSIGKGKTSIDPLLDSIAAMQGRVVKGDQLPDRGYFYRSDQLNFARIGVPAVYAESGIDFRGRPEGWGKEKAEAWEERHYHQPSDEYDPDWNWLGAIEDARMLYFLGKEIADNPRSIPTWTPGDEFERARQEALQALEKKQSKRRRSR